MIATHDTFTYCDCKNPVINIFRRWWRCQDRHVTEQIRKGAGYLDVRIRLRRNCDSRVIVCHGLADMRGMEFCCMERLLDYLDKFNVMYRLILERGNAADRIYFWDAMEVARDSHPSLMWAVIKSGWQTVFMRDSHPRIDDLCLHWNWRTVVRSLLVDVIKRNTRKVTVTPSMIEDKNTVYFVDYWRGV